MSHQTSTLNPPDNTWANYLKQQLTLLDISPDVMSDQLGISRATLYRMRPGRLLPRTELWQQMLHYIIFHPRSSLSWNGLLAWDAAWTDLSGHQHPTEPYRLLSQLFDQYPPAFLVNLLKWLSNRPDDRLILPLVRDYQLHYELNQTVIRKLEQRLEALQQQAASDKLTGLLAQVEQTIAANQSWLARHQQRLTEYDDVAKALVKLNEETIARTDQLLALTDDIAALNLWRDEVDQSITHLDQRIAGISLPALWRDFRVVTGVRWYGPLLETRWHRLIEIGVGLLVLAIIAGVYLLLSPAWFDSPVAQAGLIGVLFIIVLWESSRVWLARELDAIRGEPPTPEPGRGEQRNDPAE